MEKKSQAELISSSIYFEKELTRLYNKSKEVLEEFKELARKDIRLKHLEILSGQILVSIINLKINIEFYKKNTNDFEEIFSADGEQIGNYFHNLHQNLNENIVEACLFQTELIFRVYYAKIMQTGPAEEKMNKIFATLFDDVENNWTKEECKLFVLLWATRNVIHTGGIYMKKVNGHSLTYKNEIYNFEYGMAPKISKEGLVFNLLFDLLDAIKVLFLSKKISGLGYLEHPSYLALGN